MVFSEERSQTAFLQFGYHYICYLEWFAKDASRKVKTVLPAKYAAGERTLAYAPKKDYNKE